MKSAPDSELTPAQLRDIATARVEDAEVLYAAERYDGARYLCGYAVEMTLKAQICDTLQWPTYHSAGNFSNFRTHDFEVLLELSGRPEVKREHFEEWNAIATWNPISRYLPVGHLFTVDITNFIAAVRTILIAL